MRKKRKKPKSKGEKEQKTKCNLVQAETEAETVAVATVARLIPATAGRAAVIRIVEPRTATQHTMFARIWTLWIGYFMFRIFAVPILTPFPEVPVHIMQSPCVWWIITNGSCFSREE